MKEQIRILFVDDEKNVLRALERTFIDEDYDIQTACSGAEGLSLLENTSPVQVVVSDYRMPEMNGVCFLREVCKRWPETIRIVLSGYADIASIVAAVNDGQIYKFIPKPWNDDELKIALVNAVERYFLNRKNSELTDVLRLKNEELRNMNDSLERLVAEKNSKVMLQNEFLARVQNIHNAMPVGVIGIDPDGVIVQCNKEAEILLSGHGPVLLGNRYGENLPQEIAEFVDSIGSGESMSKMVAIDGVTVKVTVGLMDNCNQKGTILVLDKIEKTTEE